MKLYKCLLTLSLALSTLSANAATGDLVCKKNLDRLSRSIVIDTQNNYSYTEIWQGSFPTVTEQTGSADGWQTMTDTGIHAEYTFIAFDVPSKFTVNNSVGELTLGEDSAKENFSCVIE